MSAFGGSGPRGAGQPPAFARSASYGSASHLVAKAAAPKPVGRRRAAERATRGAASLMRSVAKRVRRSSVTSEDGQPIFAREAREGCRAEASRAKAGIRGGELRLGRPPSLARELRLDASIDQRLKLHKLGKRKDLTMADARCRCGALSHSRCRDHQNWWSPVIVLTVSAEPARRLALARSTRSTPSPYPGLRKSTPAMRTAARRCASAFVRSAGRRSIGRPTGCHR